MSRTILCLGMVCWAAAAMACDVCSSGMANSMTGIIPQFGNHFVGLRHQYASYRGLSATDRYHTAEAIGRFYPHRRVQLLVALPYSIRLREGAELQRSGHGLSDITVLCNYLAVNTGDSTIRPWRHTLALGGGLKLPTGLTTLKDGGEHLHRNLQPGTGSWDFVLNAQYTVRRKGLGATAFVSYKLNTADGQGYRFGNRLASSASLFYLAKAGRWQFMPSLGIQAELAQRDYDRGLRLLQSGGTEWRAMADLMVFVGRVGIGAGYRLPIGGEVASGSVTPGYQTQITAIVLF